MRKHLLFAICLPLIAGGVWLHIQIRSWAQPLPDIIAAPSDWVAFDADFQKTSPTIKLQITGHFYRSSDGSTREEWFVGGRGNTLTEIKNIVLSRYYVWKAENGYWESHPMTLPAEGWRPLERSRTMPGLTEVADLVEGHHVVSYFNPHGTVVQFQSPELNFFPLIIEDVAAGTRLAYHHIRRQSPPAEVFMPPSSAAVTLRSEPMGIVAWEPGQPKPLFPRKAQAPQ